MKEQGRQRLSWVCLFSVTSGSEKRLCPSGIFCVAHSEPLLWLPTCSQSLFLVPNLVMYLLKWRNNPPHHCGITESKYINDTIFYSVPRVILWKRQWHPTPVLLPGKSPWTEEPGRLQSMGSLESDTTEQLHFHSLFTFMHWRRKWQPTPVFLPGESQGQRSLVGCHLWGRTESDTTEVT